MKISDYLGTSYIACVDLEATCDNNPEFDRRSMEIIEFGLTLLNPEYSIVGTFDTFVRPIRTPTLTKFCKELTTITQAEIDGADIWSKVCPEIEKFFAEKVPSNANVIWVSWGDYDRKQIERDCQRQQTTNPMPVVHFNLKATDAAYRNTRNERGLQRALTSLGMEFPGTQHRAGSDALAVAMIVQNLAAGLIRSKV